MSYKNVHHTFWTDSEVKKFEPLMQHLYLYLVTGPNAHYSGVYHLPFRTIKEDTKCKKDSELKKRIDALLGFDRIRYDDTTETIFVTRMLKSQIKDGNPSPSQMGGILRHFDTLHNSFLIIDFFKYNDHLIGKYTEKNIDLETRMQYIQDKVLSSSPRSTLLTPAPPKKLGIPDEEKEKIFDEQIWPIYPTRDGVKAAKAEAKDFFIKSIKDKDIPLVLKALKNYAVSKIANDDHARDAIRFLRKEYWKDWIDVKGSVTLEDHPSRRPFEQC